MRKLLFLPIFLVAFALNAQDIHLSQYYTNQQNLNPAMVGNYSGLYRISSNYRNQWKQIGSKPITTSMVSFDHKFYRYSDEITGGFMIVNDQFSDYGLNTTKLQLAGSYKKNILSHELRGGLQIGYIMKSTNLDAQSFPNQWVYEQGIFNTNVSNGETDLMESENYLDINLGFGWSKKFAGFTPTFGFALSHINQPKDSYFDDKNSKRSITSTYHASVLKPLNSTYSVEPKIAYWRSFKSQNMLFGGNLYKTIENSLVTQLNLGLLYRDGFGRNSDALIAIAGLIYKRFDVAVSYDYNVGELSQFSNGKSTYELSLVFTAPEFLPKKLTIPCERF